MAKYDWSRKRYPADDSKLRTLYASKLKALDQLQSETEYIHELLCKAESAKIYDTAQVYQITPDEFERLAVLLRSGQLDEVLAHEVLSGIGPVNEKEELQNDAPETNAMETD